MAANNFKPFATGANANVTAQADYENLAALATGFQSGKASSAQINKAIRQASFVAAAIAQNIANKTSSDVLDNGDVNGFVQLFINALTKDFQIVNANLNALSGLQSDADKVPYFIGKNAAAMTAFTQTGRDIVGKNSTGDVITYLGLGQLYQSLNQNLIALSGLNSDTDTLPYFFGPNKAAITAFTAFARDIVGKKSTAELFSYLGIGTAANKNAGNGSGQLPDMSFFDSNFGVNGYQKLPSGLIIQWGSAPATIGTLSTKAYPIQFPNAALHVVLTHNVANDANGIGISGADVSSSNTSQFTYKPQGIQISGNSVSAASAGSGAITFHFLAIGY
ncbi:MAG: hypothetical protein LZT29_00651 [Pantoea stewartii]|uniref:gp53-like domain-containing protein n=1 Tax=Pantoea stewartii TaxID=66269 RepID=UPI0006D01E3E|nr:hypothetical protein [Pantoea stewartii]WHS97774.1 MAG: hypothetical protein LZT29_00651 [Pantoea stewartii]